MTWNKKYSKHKYTEENAQLAFGLIMEMNFYTLISTTARGNNL